MTLPPVDVGPVDLAEIGIRWPDAPPSPPAVPGAATQPHRQPDLLPLDAGEQYRFAFDMNACVGCHSCEVACSEQNGNPVGVNWRKAGEIEAGSYPGVRRFTMSMACNHCLEPTCLSGCPTNAYVKLDNGIVRHLAESCIGCRYCIWNCPYEAPVFNQERRIVTKCDMCLPRLEAGQAPACVGACPSRALSVEKVDVAAWRAEPTGADAPGLPPASITLSTTRIILPVDLPADAEPAHRWAVEPEDPHWPLVALTLLTQIALGTLVAIVGVEVLARVERPADATFSRFAPGALAVCATAGIALAASLLHLGRPAHAFKALRNVRRSWLSREVALFGAFAAGVVGYATAWWWGAGASLVAGAGAIALGGAGVYASARLYMVPARPAWNSVRTPVTFFATAAAAGPLLGAAVLGGTGLPPAWPRLLLGAGVVGIAVQLGIYQYLAASVATRRGHEWAAFGRLLFRHFRWLLALRIGCALVAVALAAIAAAQTGSAATVTLAGAAFAAAVGGEFVGRYLFFVTVVAMTADGSFFRALRAPRRAP